MRTRSQILDEIQTVAEDVLGWKGGISGETRLVEDLGLDSLRALTLVVEIENRLQVRIEPEDEADLTTIGDLVAVVARRQHDPNAC